MHSVPRVHFRAMVFSTVCYDWNGQFLDYLDAYIQLSNFNSLTVSIQLGHPVSIIVGRFCLLCRRCRFGNDVDISRIFNASLSPPFAA